MHKHQALLALATLGMAVLASGSAAQAAQAPTPLRIIAFGAHPDDCELVAGGVAAKWAALGHKFKCVAVTNGDIGHATVAGGPLAQRRRAEALAAAKILGIETDVLDNHDGELMVTLENRRRIARLIREWQADVVISHRPNDYHPDHRYTGVLVMDAAYMVQVPFFDPDVPPLRRNPVFLFSEDRFQKPNPFSGDIVVAIDDVIEKKLAVVEAMESQFYEGGCCDVPAGGLPQDGGPRHLQPAVRLDGRPLPRAVGGALRAAGVDRQIRRGVRDLRIRPAAGRSRDPAAVPILPLTGITDTARLATT
jgi:LmbE family N-acetylglucosaminyl deacetylase